ncbi:hypothetical protein H696_02963 [Fonticula alba]|uniref:Uncharacterized protein n=1 Tax=Fonticula alba TaxID=691883 RepID=A0A058Z8M9_FONAL|nr:hypothetical protein H696_02963 [Fonticula alba]KCV70605.1 hypothetical protein H696_02963 [Fonticula alba]|eukprot:XP_009495121.1 hypothetical protein H696_02963 [Fonticula alba]
MSRLQQLSRQYMRHHSFKVFVLATLGTTLAGLAASNHLYTGHRIYGARSHIDRVHDRLVAPADEDEFHMMTYILGRTSRYTGLAGDGLDMVDWAAIGIRLNHVRLGIYAAHAYYVSELLGDNRPEILRDWRHQALFTYVARKEEINEDDILPPVKSGATGM